MQKLFSSITRLGIVLAFIALFVLPSASQAQWRIGLSAGGDYNRYSIDTQYQTDLRYDGAFGWNAAVFGQYNWFDWLGLRAELEVSERNYRFYRTGMHEGTNYITHNTYALVPVLAQFSFGGTKVRGFVNLGVYGGYWAAGWQKGTFFDTFSEKVVKIDQAYLFQNEKDQRWDFGWAGGLGLEYRVAEHWALHAEARCYYSVVSSVKQYMEVKDYRYNTTVDFQIGFSYIF